MCDRMSPYRPSPEPPCPSAGGVHVPAHQSSRQPPRDEFLASLVEPIFGRLVADPLYQVVHAVLELHLRLVAQQLPRRRDVSDAVSDVAFAEATCDLRFQMPHVEQLRQTYGDLADRADDRPAHDASV